MKYYTVKNCDKS